MTGPAGSAKGKTESLKRCSMKTIERQRERKHAPTTKRGKTWGKPEVKTAVSIGLPGNKRNT